MPFLVVQVSNDHKVRSFSVFDDEGQAVHFSFSNFVSKSSSYWVSPFLVEYLSGYFHLVGVYPKMLLLQELSMVVVLYYGYSPYLRF